MSALAALAHFDGAPVDPADLTALAARSLRVAPASTELVICDWAGLACGGTRFLPETDSVQGPHGTHDDLVRVAFDGRLDNREEIARALASTAYPPRSLADAELVACAAAAWGTAAWDRLLGDFAAVVVDARTHSVTGVRDAFGIRPLLYRPMGQRVAFASSVAALAPLAPATLDEAMMGQYLAGTVMDLAGSTFREIRRVLPGHAITFTAGSSRVDRCVTIAPGPIDEQRSADAWDEELRALLDDAVRVRLRASGGVGVMLSGGLDSAAITALAAARRRDTNLRTYSLVFPGSSKDEQPWSDAVVRASDLERVHTRVAVGATPFDYAGYAAETLEPAPAPTGVTSIAMRRAAERDGVRVLLSGIGGNELFGGNWDRYADLLRHGRVWTLANEWRADRHHHGYLGWKYSLIAAVGPMVPSALRPLGRWVVGGDPVPRAIDRRFAARIDLADRIRGSPPDLAFASHAQRELWRLLTEGGVVSPLEQEQAFAATCGADERFPFYDRRLVDFTLRLPESERWSRGTSKVVLRRALAGLVPDRVVAGIASHDYSFLLVPALRELTAAHRAGDWRVVGRGWVDRGRLAALLNELQHGADEGPAGGHRSLWELWHVTAIELLLAALDA